MAQQLTDMRIRQVSLVDKGANGRTFALLKRDEEGAMTDPIATAIEVVDGDAARSGLAGLLRKAADALLGKGEPVAKVATFAEIVAGAELRDALYDSWYTLEDALWSAIYATDADGQSLSMDEKQRLVAQDLDEFKAYLLAQMTSGIEKRDGSPAARAQAAMAAVVAKVGRKISGDRMERLTAAAEALNSVLTEVAEAQDPEAAETAEEAPVEKAELVAAVTEAITKAQEPIVERLDALEKHEIEVAEVTKGDAPATLDDVLDAVSKIADRVEAIEKRPGDRTSLAGQDGTDVKKRSVFAGMF